MAKTIGRPSKYKEEYCEQAEKLARLGATDKEMADFFGVTEQTLNNWKTDKDGNETPFFESLKRGMDAAYSVMAGTAKAFQSSIRKAIQMESPATSRLLKPGA